MAYYTPLRYPGGKAKITQYIQALFIENKLCDGHYVEPYAGGAGIALQLLMTDYVSYIHLNDINYPLYCFWQSVISDTENFCRKINNCKVTVNAWNRHQSILLNQEENDALDLGFAFFFLNRTNRSGIINGGVIGGIDQNGPWKIDARFNKSALIERIQKIATFESRINLYNMDAADLIRNVIPSLPKKTLVYLDPPYYLQGNRLYENHYKHHDHVAIAQLVAKNIKHLWLVSYDNTPQIQEMYKDYRQHTYDLNYSAARSYRGSEIMIYSESLKIPTPNRVIISKAG